MRTLLRSYLRSYEGISGSVWILASVQLINRSGSMVLPFMTVYLTASLHYSLSQAGIIMSIFGAGSMLGSYLGGRFTDKAGPFRVMHFSLFAGGASYLVLPLLTDFYFLAAGIFICAVINESMRPASSSMVSHFATPDTTTRSFSLMRMAINLGVSIGPAIAGILAHVSYTWLFVGDGITNLAAGVVFYFHFRNQQPQTHKKEHPKGVAVKSPYRDFPYLLFILFCILYAAAFFQIFSSIPLYYKDVYLKPEASIGLLIGLNGLIVFIFEMMIVSKIEKKYKPRTLIFIGSVMLAVSFALFNSGHHNAILLISMALLSFSEMFAMPFMISHVIKSADDKTRGSYIGVYTIAWSIAFILSPYGSTQLIEHFNYAVLWWVMAAVCVVTAFGFNAVMREKKPVEAA